MGMGASFLVCCCSSSQKVVGERHETVGHKHVFHKRILQPRGIIGLPLVAERLRMVNEVVVGHDLAMRAIVHRKFDQKSVVVHKTGAEEEPVASHELFQ